MLRQARVRLHRQAWRTAMRGVVLCALTLAVGPACAVSTFSVTEPWVRVGTDGRSAEAYMQLRSSEGDAVVGVRSDDASEVAMLADGKAPTPVTRITLPAGETVVLAPGKARLHIGKLRKPFRLGDRVNLVLIVEATDSRQREIPVSAEVRRRSPTDDHIGKHKHASARSAGAAA